jgi:hypothetical protein
LTATSPDGMLKDTQTFHVQISDSSASSSSGNTKTDANPNSPSANHGAHSVSLHRRRVGIIVGSIIAALTATILLAFVIILCRRRKYNKGYTSPQTPRSPRKTDISRPIPRPSPIIEAWGKFDSTQEVDVEKGKDDDTPECTLEYPLQVNVPVPKKHKTNHSPSSSTGDEGHDVFTEFNSSPMGFQDEAGPSHHPHDSMKIPTAMLRRASASPSTSHKQRTSQIYREPSFDSPGLPSSRRTRNVGHRRARQRCNPSRSSNNFSMLHQSFDSTAYTERTLSVASTMVQPQPHKAPRTMQLTTPLEYRNSIRPVMPNSSTCESLDGRTIDEKRNSYFKKRASVQVQSPFFAGTASRTSSSNYPVPPVPAGDSIPGLKDALEPNSANIVKPDDDIVEQEVSRDIPGTYNDLSSRFKTTPLEKNFTNFVFLASDSLRIRRPADTPTPDSDKQRVFPGSLRKSRSVFKDKRRNTETPAAMRHEKVEEPQERIATTIYSTYRLQPRKRTQKNERAVDLKSTLDDQLKAKVFTNTELNSGSEYSDEEDEVENPDKRRTIKQDMYTVAPLSPGKSKRSGIMKESKTDTTRQSKRLSQRHPTPLSLALEHGGKENLSSSYSLGLNRSPSPTRSTTTTTTPTARTETSPLRPKTSIGVPPASSRHTRTYSRTVTYVTPTSPNTTSPKYAFLTFPLNI